MQYGAAGAPTGAGLITVCFRLEGTMELLWKCKLNMMPQPNDTCVQVANDLETEYKVESVRWEFVHDSVTQPTGYVEGVPQYGEFVPTIGTVQAPCVIVSAIIV